jgi:hypothetical protein
MKSFVRVGAVIAAATIPLFGLSAGAASAKSAKAAGRAKTPAITVTASPNPVVETDTSNFLDIIQVEAKGPASPNDTVTISSTELVSNCTTILFGTLQGGGTVAGDPLGGITDGPATTTDTGAITVLMDNDGNATIAVDGEDCSPGENLIEASETTVPYHTATTRLILSPPAVTARGVKGYPAGEVETGDGAAAAGPVGASDVYAVFEVEAPPIYAEDTESITSDQLTARCRIGSDWFSDTGTYLGGTAPGGVGVVAGSSPGTANGAGDLIDDDGNVAYGFLGASCAAGTSTVIAAISDGPTYRTTFRILPPAVTI